LSRRICPDKLHLVTITRHFVQVDGRFVHYRKAGSGPPLLMVHQSPRSSAEYIPLMERWSEHFTCIAPDTPGFGQSDPLPGEPEIDAFADAIIHFMDAAGLDRVPAYGFHSGGIILVTALKRHPQRFSALAVGGYAVWTQAEREIFGEAYLPPFQPSAYGEHLTWLWNRILEQSWFFPWFDVRPETRLSVAHDDPERVHATVMDMLAAGDAYRAGYGAVLRAPRDIPPADFAGPPVLITAYDGDPLQAHLQRLGPLPSNWQARAVVTPRQHQDESFAVLLGHASSQSGSLRDSAIRGFAPVATDDWQGLIHWRGTGRKRHGRRTRPQRRGP
jgi:pimeloyl-ACP methyl ester carboxylesterase